MKCCEICVWGDNLDFFEVYCELDDEEYPHGHCCDDFLGTWED